MATEEDDKKSLEMMQQPWVRHNITEGIKRDLEFTAKWHEIPLKKLIQYVDSMPSEVVLEFLLLSNLACHLVDTEIKLLDKIIDYDWYMKTVRRRVRKIRKADKEAAATQPGFVKPKTRGKQ